MKREVLLALACCSLVIACKDKKSETTGPGAGKKQAPPAVYDAVIAEAFPLDRNVQAPGTILPNENTDLHPEISGRVVAINFKEGAFVKQGTLLVKLFDADLQAQLKKLQVQLKVAEATEQRQKELLAINGTSQQDYDNAGLSVSNIKADMELVKVNIQKTELRAPFDGRIGLRSISLGAYVTPASIIANIAQTNMVKVEFAVPEKYASSMVPGKMVTLQTIERGKMYNATVMATQNAVAQDSRNLTVRGVVNNSDTRLTPGSFVEVRINIGDQGPTIMIPSQSVIPSTRFKSVIVSQNGLASFRKVTTGYRDSARIEIVDGLKPGDTIITTGLLSLKEGMPVKTRLASKP